jgi:hypothetical protein
MMFTRRENIERVQSLEDRIQVLRAIEYPTEAQMEELEDARVSAAEINDWLERTRDD